MVRARNSVVVFFPVNAASSSRFRKSELPENRLQGRAGEPDVDDQAVGVQLLAPEGRIDHVGGSVEPLGRSEDLAPEAVGDHEVIANVQAVQWSWLQAVVRVERSGCGDTRLPARPRRGRPSPPAASRSRSLPR